MLGRQNLTVVSAVTMATKKAAPAKQVIDDAPEAVVVDEPTTVAPAPKAPAGMTPDQAMVYAALNAGVEA